MGPPCLAGLVLVKVDWRDPKTEYQPWWLRRDPGANHSVQGTPLVAMIRILMLLIPVTVLSDTTCRAPATSLSLGAYIS